MTEMTPDDYAALERVSSLANWSLNADKVSNPLDFYVEWLSKHPDALRRTLKVAGCVVAGLISAQASPEATADELLDLLVEAWGADPT